MQPDQIVMMALLVFASTSGRVASAPGIVTSDQTPAGFHETHWRAVELAGEAVPTLPANREPHLVFDESGSLAGSDGCNRIIGRYTRKDEDISFEPMGATRMRCPEEGVSRVEASFNAALKNAARVKIANDRLELLDAAGKRVALFAARSTPSAESVKSLEGRSWQLVRVDIGNEMKLVPPDPSKYTVTFANNGRLRVHFDCNSGRGRWRTGADRLLNFGELSMTRVTCPEGSLQDEILKMWTDVDSYTIRDGHLVLSLKNGQRLVFEPQPARPR